MQEPLTVGNEQVRKQELPLSPFSLCGIFFLCPVNTLVQVRPLFLLSFFYSDSAAHLPPWLLFKLTGNLNAANYLMRDR